MMDGNTVIGILETLENASIRVWLDGGWGVDALLGEQTREHTDLDIVLDVANVSKLRRTLHAVGFRVTAGSGEANFVLSNDHGHKIDVHPIEFDEHGYGFFKLVDGRIWPFPAAAFAGKGKVGKHQVRCLSVDAQIQCHGQGYKPTENDLRDMEQLQQRFGIVLPISLCRQQSVSPAQQIAASDRQPATRAAGG